MVWTTVRKGVVMSERVTYRTSGSGVSKNGAALAGQTTWSPAALNWDRYYESTGFSATTLDRKTIFKFVTFYGIWKKKRPPPP